MARSIHKTVKGVFRGASKATVDAMTNPDAPDPDVQELWKKSRYKKAAVAKKATGKVVAATPQGSEEE